MIHNLDQMQEVIAEAIGGKVYLSYPEKRTSTKRPFAVLSVIPTSHQRDNRGRDISTLLTYTVRLHGGSERANLDLMDRVDSAIAPFHATVLGASPSYSSEAFGPYRIMTFDLIIDRHDQTHSTR